MMNFVKGLAPKTWSLVHYSRVFFLLVNYNLLHKQVIISKFFHSITSKARVLS
jgi:hypothetical protein